MAGPPRIRPPQVVHPLHGSGGKDEQPSTPPQKKAIPVISLISDDEDEQPTAPAFGTPRWCAPVMPTTPVQTNSLQQRRPDPPPNPESNSSFRSNSANFLTIEDSDKDDNELTTLHTSFHVHRTNQRRKKPATLPSDATPEIPVAKIAEQQIDRRAILGVPSSLRQPFKQQRQHGGFLSTTLQRASSQTLALAPQIRDTLTHALSPQPLPQARMRIRCKVVECNPSDSEEVSMAGTNQLQGRKRLMLSIHCVSTASRRKLQISLSRAEKERRQKIQELVEIGKGTAFRNPFRTPPPLKSTEVATSAANTPCPVPHAPALELVRKFGVRPSAGPLAIRNKEDRSSQRQSTLSMSPLLARKRKATIAMSDDSEAEQTPLQATIVSEGEEEEDGSQPSTPIIERFNSSEDDDFDPTRGDLPSEDRIWDTHGYEDRQRRAKRNAKKAKPNTGRVLSKSPRTPPGQKKVGTEHTTPPGAPRINRLMRPTRQKPHSHRKKTRFIKQRRGQHKPRASKSPFRSSVSALQKTRQKRLANVEARRKITELSKMPNSLACLDDDEADEVPVGGVRDGVRAPVAWVDDRQRGDWYLAKQQKEKESEKSKGKERSNVEMADADDASYFSGSNEEEEE